MAQIMQKGLQTYTVQEAENAALGQLGSVYLDGTSVSTTQPRVIVAITALTDCAFDTLTAELDKNDGSANYINTSGASSLGGDAYTNSDVIPKGCTIYGRWVTVDAKAGDKCICYFG